jgi:hypothetical protein
LSVLEAICEQKEYCENLEIFGTNLYNCWRGLDYRRLSEQDLKAKKTLMDGAKTLQQARFDQKEAAPIMILLLSSLFEYRGLGVSWAKDRIGDRREGIPTDVLESIFPYLGSG